MSKQSNIFTIFKLLFSVNLTLDYKTFENFLNKSGHFHLQKKDTVKRLEKEYRRLTKLEDFSG